MTAPMLMKHQEEGVGFLLKNRSGLLAFEQGLGKTLIAIEAFRRLRAAGEADLLVVLCPNSLKRNWTAEIAKFAPELRAAIVEGDARKRRQQLGVADADAMIINYEAARSEIIGIRALLARRRAALVLDESHYVKNARSRTSVAAQHIAPLAAHRWLLSGTPLTNAPGDLYPQITLVTGGAPFGPLDSFLARYGDAAVSREARIELHSRIRPYVLRRTKEECLDLPDKTFVDVLVELPPWQRKLYDAVRDGIVREVEEMDPEKYRQFASSALVRLLRLSQIASNPALVSSEERRVPGKFLEMDELVDELVLGSRRKVIIWSYYVKSIKTLEQRYRHLGVAVLYGEVAPEDRQAVARRFQEDGGTMVLVANPAAAGTGFTLTAASYAIYETLSWRYDLYAQSQDRAHRIGQQLPVTCIRLIAADTIEQVIAQALERKAEFAGTVLGDEPPDSSIASLTPEQFCLMLANNELPAVER